LITSQLINSEACRHRDIMKTFGVSKKSVNRALKKYRQGGADTLRKAINDGRLVQAEKVYPDNNHRDCDKSSRNVADALASDAGVICALPALLVNGLLDGIERFLGIIKGYYTVFHVLLVVAFMSLCRIKSVEQLRGKASGEFGKTIGIDRIADVRCHRENIADIVQDIANTHRIGP